MLHKSEPYGEDFKALGVHWDTKLQMALQCREVAQKASWKLRTLLKTLPFPYKSIQPEERYISDKNNPPKVSIQFYDNLTNLNNINCFSNEEDKWRNSKIKFDSKNNLNVSLDGKFITERGRINCSLRENNGFYRWLGIQFVVKEK